MSNRQAEPLLRRKDDLHVAYWNVRTLQDVGVQAVTMRELRKHKAEVRIPDSGHSVIKVPGEEACYHLYHSGVVDNTGRHGVAIALSGETTLNLTVNNIRSSDFNVQTLKFCGYSKCIGCHMLYHFRRVPSPFA